MIAIDLNKEQALEADLKVIQQSSLNFTGNLNQTWYTTMFFIIEEAREILDFSQGTLKVLQVYFLKYNVSKKRLKITL